MNEATSELVRTSYRLGEVAAVLRLPEEWVRSAARAGWVVPTCDDSGEERFTFRDLAALRTAKRMQDAGNPDALIQATLARLHAQAGADAPIASGQAAFDFSNGEPPASAAPGDGGAVLEEAEGWFRLGCELEPTQPARAKEAYRRAVVLHPEHADAHINLGRLLHESKDAVGAERHYRAALALRPLDAIAAFDLGTALEDQGRLQDAIGAYALAIAADPSCADAYFNLARLYERAGRRAEALRHLKAYRQLAPGT